MRTVPIDRLILNDVTGDLWTYGVLDDVTNLISTAASSTTNDRLRLVHPPTPPSSQQPTDLVAGAVESVMPSTSTLLYGLGRWQHRQHACGRSVTGSTASLASYLLKMGANSTSGRGQLGAGLPEQRRDYVCYVNGEQTTYKTSVKYPVLAGGIAGAHQHCFRHVSGTMAQLLPVVTVDEVGAASVRERTPPATRLPMRCRCICGTRARTIATTLSQVNGEEYSLIGWYDAHGSAAGGKIRVLVAVKKD